MCMYIEVYLVSQRRTFFEIHLQKVVKKALCKATFFNDITTSKYVLIYLWNYKFKINLFFDLI